MRQTTKSIARPRGSRMWARLRAMLLVATLVAVAYVVRSREAHDHFGKPAQAQQAQSEVAGAAEPVLSEAQVAAGISLRLEQLAQRGAMRSAGEGPGSGQPTAVSLQTTTASAPSYPVPRGPQEELAADNADVPPDIEQ